jgi:hypothetical protein
MILHDKENRRADGKSHHDQNHPGNKNNTLLIDFWAFHAGWVLIFLVCAGILP